LVVLTDPMPIGKRFFIEHLKSVVRFTRSYLVKPEPKLRNSKYRGHFAVTRSLVEGLQRLNIPFQLNPIFFSSAKTVIVLAGVETLKQAIMLKRQGKIDKLVAGPNVIVFSSDHDNLIASTEIDLCIVPSDWCIDLYISENASLANRIATWPAGVDEFYWKEDPTVERKYITFFEKHNKNAIPDTFLYRKAAEDAGYEIVVLRYGEFVHTRYLEVLQGSLLLVGFVSNESQGIAWAEAWACNVPTFLWENTKDHYLGKEFVSSTAPYLRQENGMFFSDLSDFQEKLNQFKTGGLSFEPRKWLEQNMTDEVSAKILIDKISKIK
jgi:hypothetical protein